MEHQQLIIRGNRYLAAALLESKLIKSEHVEKANAGLLKAIQAGNYKQASLLSILIYDMQVLVESELIEWLVENYKVGLIHLGNLDLKAKIVGEMPLELCWSTWTLPFDVLDNCVCVATCYHLSKPVVDHWEKLLGRQVIWYVTSMHALSEALDRLESEALEAAESQS